MITREALADWIANPAWDPTRETYGMPMDEALALVDDYAHALAEQIRTSMYLRDLTDDHMRDCNAAADLIDPEVPQ